MRIRRMVVAFGLATAMAAGLGSSLISAQHRLPQSEARIPAANYECINDAGGFNFGSTATQDPALIATVNNGKTARNWIVQLSAENETPAGNGFILVRYSIDGGPLVSIGPEFFSSDEGAIQTRTAIGVRSVGPGTHTLRVFWQLVGAGAGATAQVYYRCLTVEAKTQ